MELGENSSGKLFRFKLGNEEFAVEIYEFKRISLCRILDPIAELAKVKQNEIIFLYNNKEIFGLNCLEPLSNTIMIHTPNIPAPNILAPNIGESNPFPSKSICKLHLHFQDQTLVTWSLSGQHPKISDFLSTLYIDDDYKKIFTMKFDVFKNNKKISKKKYINNFENFDEFHIYPAPMENPIKVYFNYTGYSNIECIYDKSTKWKKVSYNMRYYIGQEKTIRFEFNGTSITIDDRGGESLEVINLENQTVEIKDVLDFTDKHFLNKIEFNTKAPDFREIIPGLNLKCICKYDTCELKNEFIMEKLGYGRFKYSSLKQDIKCKKCKNLVEIKAFGIYKAFLRLNLFDVNSQYLEEFENFEDYYVSLDFFMRKYKNLTEIWFECKDKIN